MNEENATLMFCLMQKDVRELRRVGAAYLTIGIHVMKVGENSSMMHESRKRDSRDLKSLSNIQVEENRKYRLHQIMQGVGTSEYANTRSVFLKLKVIIINIQNKFELL